MLFGRLELRGWGTAYSRSVHGLKNFAGWMLAPHSPLHNPALAGIGRHWCIRHWCIEFLKNYRDFASILGKYG